MIGIFYDFDIVPPMFLELSILGKSHEIRDFLANRSGDFGPEVFDGFEVFFIHAQISSLAGCRWGFGTFKRESGTFRLDFEHVGNSLVMRLDLLKHFIVIKMCPVLIRF